MENPSALAAHARVRHSCTREIIIRLIMTAGKEKYAHQSNLACQSFTRCRLLFRSRCYSRHGFGDASGAALLRVLTSRDGVTRRATGAILETLRLEQQHANDEKVISGTDYVLYLKLKVSSVSLNIIYIHSDNE